MIYEPLKSTQFIVRELMKVERQNVSLVIGIRKENQVENGHDHPETTAAHGFYRVIVESDADLHD